MKYQDFKNDTIKKGRKHMNWIKGRLTEISSLHGGALIAMGLVVLFAGPFAKIAAYAAIGYGAWTLWKKEK